MPKIPKVILLIESSRASGRSLLRGVAKYARHHGPWAFYWEPRGLEKVWSRLKRLHADGIILRDVEKVDDVIRCGLPAIVVGHRKQAVPGVANVMTDSARIGTMAADHLLDCGFRHFAYCGFDGIPWSNIRGRNFADRVVAAGFSVHFYRQRRRTAVRSGEGEELFMAEWLRSLPKPLGVMACNDDRGQHVIEACKVAGLRVPDEVAVIGADNDELVCELSDPPMSSVAINFERAGYDSAELLAKLMAGRRSVSKAIVVRPTHVIARQSTNILAIEDAHVAKSLRFIRLHGREAIQVNDVVAASGLSRRVLEKRFRKLLGRSVLSEIRRVRVAQICRLLAETNLSVSQIADSLGYTSIEHIARYFRSEMKLSPLAYRRQHGHK
ncbi:MAG: DNA-binding transcriptional regulator [Verrucomicrobia bacterium]|nr:DNA-binding transcriptional regulator [Verrucomicrobiota bacterium]